MARLRTRRFSVGDEAALNDVYLHFVSDRWPNAARSLPLMRWLWYESPAGPADSWLVEAENADGSWRIVGHHGLCPMRFTLGDVDLVCGKTTNTFLMPEFRSEFVYLRFEQQCLAEVRSKYDITYSNAPGVTRLRQALGYVKHDSWIELEHGSARFDLATRGVMRLVQHRRHAPWTQLARAWRTIALQTARRPPFSLVEYSPDEAAASAFFSDFWPQARGEAGLSPRRDVADLSWRYWKRPGARVATLVHTWASGARAFALVDVAYPYNFSLLDFFVTPMRADLLDAFLDALFCWSLQRGALTLRFGTTASGQPAHFMDVFRKRMRPHPMSRWRAPSDFVYRVSPAGHAAGLKIPAWNVTDFVVVERPITSPSPSSTHGVQ